jgi:hypothetical protein
MEPANISSVDGESYLQMAQGVLNSRAVKELVRIQQRVERERERQDEKAKNETARLFFSPELHLPKRPVVIRRRYE